MSWFSRLVKPFTPKGPPTVNVIRFQGVIGGRGPRSLTFQNLDKVILKAFTAGVHPPEAVALAVNSPGGSPVQSALIGERIRTLAGRTKIPVLGFAEDVAASGGYWLLASADEIYADHSSIVGSVGVVSGGFGLPELIRRLGVERRLYTAGEKKGALDPFKPVKPEEVQKIQETLAQIHHVFKSYVKEQRGSKLNEECLNGDFFVGEQGLKLGLVDKMGLMQPVLRERFGDDVKIQVVNPPRLPFPWSLGGGQNSSLSWPSSEALVATVLDELQDRADEHVLRSRFGL